MARFGRMMLVGFAAAALVACAGERKEAQEMSSDDPAATETGDSALSFTMNRLDGAPEDLRAYEGKVVLIVNTASKCGLTPQYAGLEELYEKHRDDGLVVLGFPSNDFGGQEPLSNAGVAEFCRTEYGVTFPMFEKISVRGEGAHPLYARLAEQSAEPNWNFTKYLLDRNGRLVQRFDPRVQPDDPELVAEVDRLLATTP